MKVLGVVAWRALDKLGNPIAGVVPLFESTKGDWRAIDAQDEFPKQGQIFWPLAREAQEKALVFVNPKENPGGQKDEFRVDSFEFAPEVLDLRDFGDPMAVGNAIVHGLRRTEPVARTVFLWCAPSVLVGPVKLSPPSKGTLALESFPRHRIGTFHIGAEAVKRVNDGRNDRFVFSVELGAPSGFVDWDDDHMIVRRALTAAVERAKLGGIDPGLTKKLIEDAATAVAGISTGPELQLEKYRLERALSLCANAELIAGVASDLAKELLQHPDVSRSLDALKDVLKQELQVSLRAEISAELAAARTELDRVIAATDQRRQELASANADLATIRQDLVAAKDAVERQTADADLDVGRRLTEVLSKPSALFAEIAILRPFLGASPKPGGYSTFRASVGQTGWAESAAPVADRIALQRALAQSFKARGVAPGSALRLHAAVASGLVPVMIGSAGLRALAAYAHAACGARLCALHVSPNFMGPVDLFGQVDVERETFYPHASGLFSAIAAADSLPGPSIFVCAGLNRAPTESYLVPLLQSVEAGVEMHIPFLGEGRTSPMRIPDGLRLAATAIVGATCLPVTRDLWSTAVAIEVHASAGTSGPIPIEPSEVLLSSELWSPLDVPTDLVDELLEACPNARDSRKCLERFGAALGRFESEREKVRAALVECVLLPLVACAPSEDERSDSLERIQRLGVATDAARPLAMLEKHLRSTLG